MSANHPLEKTQPAHSLHIQTTTTKQASQFSVSCDEDMRYLLPCLFFILKKCPEPSAKHVCFIRPV